MAFGKFKKQTLLKKFKRELKLIPETRTPNAKEIHSVAILTNNALYVEMDIAEHVISSIESVRNVHIYSYRAFKKSDPITYKHFTEKDIDWSGKIKDPSLESFLENPFDLLIGYFDTNNLYLEYCALKSNATFKIGFSKVNDRIFDLVVSEDPKNIGSFIDVIKKYLELLHKI
jgi:hypothetical protein